MLRRVYWTASLSGPGRFAMRLEDDAGAGFSIRAGVVVAQGDVQASTNILEAGWIDFPGLPSKSHRTHKRHRRQLEPSHPAARFENGAVEGTVMCRHK